jgi:EXS family
MIHFSTIALDLVLRFMWVLTLVPPTSGASFALPDYLNALTMMLELFRRTLWGFFRLENEHRSNVSGHRRIGFVPLHFNTGHQHAYEDKKEKRGASVLREVALVAIVVASMCFGSIVAAQHANQHITKMEKEL